MARKQTRRSIQIAVLALLGFGPATAQAADENYLNVQGAIADVEDLDNGISGIVTLGVPMTHVHSNFSAEGEFSLSIIEPETGDDRDLSYFTLGGYGVMSLPLNERVGVRGRLGLIYQDLEVEQAGSDSDFGLGFGVGMTFALESRARFIAEINVIDSDSNINHFSAGIQFPL